MIPGICGNGIVEDKEECDGPYAGLQPCSVNCKQERCGNHIIDDDAVTDIHEVCDDGNNLDGDGCSHDCTSLERCGDGKRDPGEECDGLDGPQPCSKSCRQEVCGNGILDPGEECDDRNLDNGDGCSHDCKFERCGNGNLDPGEECDGPLVGAQPCSPSCHQERCGNGILDDDAKATPEVHEQCDLGPANNDEGVCTTACQLARCGDTFVQPAEQCDNGEGTNDDHADCTSACRFNVCGDGLKDTAGPDHIEECDDGMANTDHPACAYNATCTACSTHCQTLTVHPTCGDGVVDSPVEVCDDHNTDACGSCSETCGVVTSKRAFGFILAVSSQDLVDGETFTLDDGVNPPEVFEFDIGDGVLDGHVAVVYGVGSSAADVRTAIEAAIRSEHAAGRLLIAPDSEPDSTDQTLALLVHDRPTSHGNQPIKTDVVTPAFFVAGMFGGQGGDCDGGVACGSDDDCTSHHCNAQHVCETSQVPEGSPRVPGNTHVTRRLPASVQ